MHESLLRRLALYGYSGSDGNDTADADRLAEVRSILSTEEQIGALTDDELGATETELFELVDRIIDGTASGIGRNDTEALTEIAEALDAIRGEAASRLAALEEQQEQVDALLARIRPEADPDPEADPEADPEPAAEVDPPADPEPVADPEPEAEVVVVVDEPQPVLASAQLPTLAEMAARTSRSRRTPSMQHARTEDRFIRALERGEMQDLQTFASTLAERWQDLRGTAPGQGEVKFRLGRISLWDRFPEDRILRSSDSWSVNDAKIDAVTASAMRPESWSNEIVASGGFCAPTPAEYDLMQLSGAQRPVRDALARFLADRGGIRFTPPPDMSQVLVDQAGGAVGLWTNTKDITPGEDTKTCQVVPCGSPEEVFTQAIYRCLGFGNFGARAYPEWVRTWTLNTAAAWARESERELLDGIDNACTSITETGLYGFVSELLTHIVQLAAGERNRQRMDPETRVRVLLPAWVPAQMQIDYLRQGNVETSLRSVAELRAMFSNANVNVSFYEDERTGSGQIVGPQGGGGAKLRDLPDVVEWYMWHEGAFQFLDGGSLDLGVVRDSTLNATNDFQIFAENWEGVAFRGIWAYRCRDTLCPSGQRQAPKIGDTFSDPCAAS